MSISHGVVILASEPDAMLSVTKFLPQLQPPEVLIQPQRRKRRNIDFWDSFMEPHILKAVSIIVFENLQKVFKGLKY